MINGDNFNNHSKRPHILVAPLDWGLGHTTRCIPIIKHLIFLNIDLTIIASGNSFFLLKKEFPQLKILQIKGYKIHYSRKKKNLPFVLLAQFPKLIFTVIREHYWLKNFLKNNKADAVISDNRFGLYNKKIVSVYITHQLLIKTGNSFIEKVLQQFHYFFIKKFTRCWVPDYEKNGLAGDLSHPKKIPANAAYIGSLSRFEILSEAKKIFDVLILISGPEPQRTIFEQIIISQSKNSNKKILLIRGLPQEKENLQTTNASINIINHLSAEEMNTCIQQSKLVISRCGYSTVMDLVRLRANAVLVPTPGQTEQEYLAEYLMQKKYFICMNQDNFKINEAMEMALTFQFIKADQVQLIYKNVLNEFVQSLKSGKFATQ